MKFDITRLGSKLNLSQFEIIRHWTIALQEMQLSGTHDTVILN